MINTLRLWEGKRSALEESSQTSPKNRELNKNQQRALEIVINAQISFFKHIHGLIRFDSKEHHKNLLQWRFCR